MKKVFTFASLALSVAMFGCEKAPEKPAAKEDVKPAASKTGEPEQKGPGSQGSHGGELIELGTSKIGDFEVRASRDKAEIKPGGDAPVDVWVNGGVGEGVKAVRFWIGVESAKQSIKARAEIEDGKWHNHVEIPSPIPSGSKLWVEIELAEAKKITGSFDLKN